MGLLSRFESYLPKSVANVVDEVARPLIGPDTPAPVKPPPPAVAAPPATPSHSVAASVGAWVSGLKAPVAAFGKKVEDKAMAAVAWDIKNTIDALGYVTKNQSLLSHFTIPQVVPVLDHLQQLMPKRLVKPFAILVDAALIPNGLNRAPLNAVPEQVPAPHDPSAVLDDGLSPTTTGNEIIPYVDGAAYKTELLKQIAGAKKSIWLQAYEWDDDASGHDISHALIAAHKANPALEIKIITDNRQNLSAVSKIRPQSFPDSPVVKELRAAGINIRQTLLSALRVDHRKISIFDAGVQNPDGTMKEVAFIGGQNVGSDYMTDNAAAKPTLTLPYHDNSKRMRGPVVHDIATVFAKSWFESGGDTLTVPPRSPALSGVQGAAANVQIITHKGGVDRNVERELVQRIDAEGTLAAQPGKAAPRIVLANGFGMTDAVYESVLSARARGVDVTWLWGYVDDDTAQMAAYHFDDLKKAGVHLLRDQQAMHMKEYYFAQQDAELSGSSNLDGFSNTVNDEAEAQIWGGGVATHFFNSTLSYDLAHAVPMTSAPAPLKAPSMAHELEIKIAERVVDGDFKDYGY